MLKILTVKNLFILSVVLYVFALFFRLGSYPLYLEEPRRALITLEMMIENNAWVPTENGAFYFKKPPFYQWVLSLAYRLMGVNEFSTRFFSSCSFLMMAFATFWISKKYINEKVAILATLFVLSMSDILFYFSAIGGEIDLFYSAFTFISFVWAYHLYVKKNWYAFYTVLYGFQALGVLTKGLPAIVFLIVSLFVFVLIERKIHFLFQRAHLLGVSIALSILGIYVFQYNQYHDITKYFTDAESLATQAGNRTLLSSNGLYTLKHLFAFPLLIIQNVAPASLLFLFFPFLNKSRWGENALIYFSILFFLFQISVYWISPGTRSRYVYMLYPFLVIILVYFYHQYHQNDLRQKIWQGFMITIVGLAMVVSFMLPFFKETLYFVPQLTMLALIFGIIFFFLLLLLIKLPDLRIMFFLLSFPILRIMFDFIVLPERSQSSSNRDKLSGYSIASLAKSEPVFLYKDTHISYTSLFYATNQLKSIIRKQPDLMLSGYYILHKKYWEECQSFDKIDSVLYKNEYYPIIKVNYVEQ